jgi:methionyl-tRNA synthetase
MKFYITTAIDYPNARPHIGTAFEKIGADVQARYQRFIGNDVHFLMGNDENTVKVVRRSQELNEPVKAYVDRMAEDFKAVWKSLDISNDDFIQTSEERHRIGVQKFIQQVCDNDYIYKKPYKGWYCEGCEEFKLEKDLKDVNGLKICPNHPLSHTIVREEENYFFKLSMFKNWILGLFENGDMSALPESRLNEMKKFIETDLDDISISRNNEGWGIPIPWDNSQVVYVWFDALLNYITAIGYGSDEERFKKWWPADVHVIGKDITRFHCAIWPAMIAAYNKNNSERFYADRAYPRKVFAHGFITQKKGEEEVKIGKSTGACADPAELVAKYGSDAYRYYFLSKCPFASDGTYSEEHFHEVYNSELANTLGNLASRVGAMILKHGGNLPKVDSGDFPAEQREIAKANWQNQLKEWQEATEAYDYRKALSITWSLLTHGNKYFDEQKPWTLIRKNDEVYDQAKARNLCVILRNSALVLRAVAMMLKPYLPKVSERLYNSYQWPVPWSDLSIKDLQLVVAESDMGDIGLAAAALVKDGNNVVKYAPLLPKVDR